MLVTRKSRFSGKINHMDLDITEAQFTDYMGGERVQDAFPNLTASEREFILTGTTPEEWDEMFGDEDDGVMDHG